MSRSGSPLHAAVIGTSDIVKSLSFYRDVIGMTVIVDETWQGEAFEHHWQVPRGMSAHAVLLQADDSGVGQVLLLQFDADSGRRIRDEGVRSAYGLFNLNLYVDDVHKVADELKKQGFDLWAEPVAPDFENKEGHSIEAVFDDPDGVAMNLIQLVGGDENSFIGRVRMEVETTRKTRTGFTPVATSSHIAKGGEAAISFYRDVLGMSVAMDLEMSTPDANEMLGRPRDGKTRTAFLEGPHPFGKIVVSSPVDYELPDNVPAAVAPNTGYIAQTFLVPDIEQACTEALDLGGALFSSAASLHFPGLDRRDALVLRCPGSGALIELISEH